MCSTWIYGERERERELLTLMREPDVEGGTPTGLSENLIKSIITFLGYSEEMKSYIISDLQMHK